VPDPNFPASGPVYQTGVKWLPAVAGESRSMDANGQWFKVLGSGGVETFQLGEGFFGTAPLPIAGVNPPKPAARPPLKPDEPCENQSTPDLHTKPGAAPRKVSVDWKDPAVQARYAKSRESALAWLQSSLDSAGVKGKVSDVDATLQSITDLAAKNGLSKQLPYLKRSLVK
jgi:hypothetical protein